MNALGLLLIIGLVALATYFAWPTASCYFVENKNRKFGASRGYWVVKTNRGKLLLTEHEFAALIARSQRNPEDL